MSLTLSGLLHVQPEQIDAGLAEHHALHPSVVTPARACGWAVATTCALLLFAHLNLWALINACLPLARSTRGLPLVGIRNLQHVWSYTLINVAAAVAIWSLAAPSQNPGPIARALSHRAITVVGWISYGMYVFHWPVL